MNVVDIPLVDLQEAPWNPNVMGPGMYERLKESVHRFGNVENLVVRPVSESRYEVISGNHRLRVLRELGYETAPCLVVDLNDDNARLLGQALNHIEGEDDPGQRAAVLRDIMQTIPEGEVLSILCETGESLQAIASLGTEGIAEHLQVWQKAQSARLEHLTFQLTGEQLPTVEGALSVFLSTTRSSDSGNPNTRGEALYRLCQAFLRTTGGKT